MSMNPPGPRLVGPRTHQCVRSVRGWRRHHSSGLILLFEEPRLVTGVRVVVGTTVTGGMAMRTFFSDTTKIDVIAHISGDDLEVDRLVLRGSRDRKQPPLPLSKSWSPVTVAGRWRSMQWLPRRSLSADLLSGRRIRDAHQRKPLKQEYFLSL